MIIRRICASVIFMVIKYVIAMNVVNFVDEMIFKRQRIRDMKNSALTKQVLQKMIKEEAAKFLVKKQEERKASGTITAGRLQQIIKEEIESYLMELAPGGESEKPVAQAGVVSKISDKMEKALGSILDSVTNKDAAEAVISTLIDKLDDKGIKPDVVAKAAMRAGKGALATSAAPAKK